MLAIVDTGFNPYHIDFAADLMPQHLDNDPDNDLPLHLPPHEWLPGFPEPSSFSSYEAMDLTIDSTQTSASPTDLHGKDASEWSKAKTSTLHNVHFRYIPGTKVIGFVNMDNDDGFGAATHGVGTTSVSVGNIHGSCPECLLVFVDGYSVDANPWMSNQPWIDVQSNSWGRSTTVRDNIYFGCTLPPLQAGVERGQQIFWSAGNGQANAFVAPTSTLHSCQKGPDFLVTVGAISPSSQSSYSGHGKPVDVSSYGSGYPSAGGDTIAAESTFSGTSNAAPVTAGMYASSLRTLRAELESPRLQSDGIIAAGPAGCGAQNPNCALADGMVTVHELREAFFRAAERTPGVITWGGAVALPIGGEAMDRFTEGHGSFHARLGNMEQEIRTVLDEVYGHQFDEMTEEDREYMIAYSYCSQQIWGEWQHGFWKPGDPVPADDLDDLYKTWMANDCEPFSTVLG